MAGKRWAGLRGGALGVALVAAGVHSPLWRADYIQDDHIAVERNAVVERGSLAEIFGSPYWAGVRGADTSLYRPVTVWSFALERAAVGRPDPRLAHAANIALHALASVALLALARRFGMGAAASLCAALLFAVHPIHVEAVASIVGRAEILAALFTFLALWMSSHTGAWPPSGTQDAALRPAAMRLAAWGTGACVFLALGAKESALVAPALVLLAETWRRPAPGRRGAWLLERACALAPTALAVEIYLWLRARAIDGLFPLQRPDPSDNPLLLLDGAERAATALGIVWRALRLLSFPFGLSIDYSGGAIPLEPSLLGPRPVIGAAVLAGLLLLALSPWLRRSGGAALRNPRVAVSLGACMTLLPWLIVGNVAFDLGTIFAERLLYLPSSGYCLICGLAVSRLAKVEGRFGKRPAGAWTYGAFGIAVAAFGWLSADRAFEWRDDETVFAAAARVHPASPRPHLVLGRARLAEGRRDEALRHFERAIEAWPSHLPAWLEKGSLHGQRGEYVEAERAFREAVRIEPAHPSAWLNLAIALHRQGRLAEAEAAALKAVLPRAGLADEAAEEASPKAWAELGHLRFETGRYALAAEAYRRAVAGGRRDLVPRLREAEARGAGPEGP